MSHHYVTILTSPDIFSHQNDLPNVLCSPAKFGAEMANALI